MYYNSEFKKTLWLKPYENNSCYEEIDDYVKACNFFFNYIYEDIPYAFLENGANAYDNDKNVDFSSIKKIYLHSNFIASIKYPLILTFFNDNNPAGLVLTETNDYIVDSIDNKIITIDENFNEIGYIIASYIPSGGNNSDNTFDDITKIEQIYENRFKIIRFYPEILANYIVQIRQALQDIILYINEVGFNGFNPPNLSLFIWSGGYMNNEKSTLPSNITFTSVYSINLINELIDATNFLLSNNYEYIKYVNANPNMSLIPIEHITNNNEVCNALTSIRLYIYNIESALLV